MKVNDIFSYAFGAIRLRKLRAGLTILGVVIGIAAIVALLSISQGLQASISGQLESGFATDTLIVTAGGLGSGIDGGIGAPDTGFRLLVNDTTFINELSADIELWTAIIQRSSYIESGENTLITTINGVVFEEYSEIYSNTFVAESGTISSTPGNEEIVAGKRVSDPWENGTLFCSVNDNVNVIWPNAAVRPPQNETYTGNVTAILQEIGGFGIGPSDSSTYIPLSQAQSFFDTDECEMIIVKLSNSDQATIDDVSEIITNAFNGQVSVISSTAVLSIVSTIFSTIELFLAGIAGISLLVAGIGIMNIMIVSLMERTREIGILKALGTKSRTVLAIFLSEAMIVGLIGSAIGVVSGWALATVASGFLGGGFSGVAPPGAPVSGGIAVTPVLTPVLILGAMAFGLIISIIFALYPAWRASKLKPVDALRYE